MLWVMGYGQLKKEKEKENGLSDPMFIAKIYIYIFLKSLARSVYPLSLRENVI